MAEGRSVGMCAASCSSAAASLGIRGRAGHTVGIVGARRRNRSLVGMAMVAAVMAALGGLTSGFVGPVGLRSQAGSRHSAKHSLVAMQAEAASVPAEEPKKSENEMSDLELLLDRFNTRGGAILATFLALGAGLGLEKLLEVAGLESIYAGIWTSAIFFFGMLVWISQYLFRVMTKSTTYAQQLKDYEQQVMMKRLQELDEEEIAALMEEVGVTQEEVDECVGDKYVALTKKDKVLELFKSTNTPQDPRASI